MRKNTVALLSLVLSLSAVSCRPAIPDVGCVTRVNLPAITPVGAMDCGEFEFGERNGVPVLEGAFVVAVQCANASLLAQTPFILRKRGTVPSTEPCPPNARCPAAFGTVAAYVGGPVSGVYAITLYSDSNGPIAQYLDGGIVPNLPDGGFFAQRLQMRKRICQPAPGAVLASLPTIPLLTIECVASGGTSMTLHSQESQNACMGQ